MAESGLAFRIQTILESDYFLTSYVEFWTISHGLPVLAEKQQERVRITLNPDGQTVKLLLSLYDSEFTAFGSMSKDFVRTVIFPRVADYVPSSTRQGAEAFLKAIRRPRELFEYADDDLGSLPTIWADYNEGKITLNQAVDRSRTAARSSIQVVDHATSARDVVPGPEVRLGESRFNRMRTKSKVLEARFWSDHPRARDGSNAVAQRRQMRRLRHLFDWN